MAVERAPASRALVLATIAALSAIVIAITLAVISLHQPTLTPVSVPTQASL